MNALAYALGHNMARENGKPAINFEKKLPNFEKQNVEIAKEKSNGIQKVKNS